MHWQRMYNKLFSKIVDSSIWLEPSPTRIVWVMFIAVMDEDGFVEIASPANVAHKARISETEAEEALRILESPDENSANQDNEGRRIERVDGGWMVINAPIYRGLVTREIAKEQTRLRVARHRAAKQNVTQGNAPVTQCNESVTPSGARATSAASAKKSRVANPVNAPLDFIAELKKNDAYKGIDIDREIGKMQAWLLTPRGKGRKLTKGFVVNWLNKVDAPLEQENKPAPKGRNVW